MKKKVQRNPLLEGMCVKYFETYPNKEASTREVHTYIMKCTGKDGIKSSVAAVRAYLQKLVDNGFLTRSKKGGFVSYKLASNKEVTVEPIFLIPKTKEPNEYSPPMNRRIMDILLKDPKHWYTNEEVMNSLERTRKPEEPKFKLDSLVTWFVKLINIDRYAEVWDNGYNRMHRVTKRAVDRRNAGIPLWMDRPKKKDVTEDTSEDEEDTIPIDKNILNRIYQDYEEYKQYHLDKALMVEEDQELIRKVLDKEI